MFFSTSILLFFSCLPLQFSHFFDLWADRCETFSKVWKK